MIHILEEKNQPNPLYNKNDFSIDPNDIQKAYDESVFDINYFQDVAIIDLSQGGNNWSGFAEFPDIFNSTFFRAGNIYMNPPVVPQGGIGSWFCHLFMHELGHAIGLFHPHDGDNLLPGTDGNTQSNAGPYLANSVFFTNMSYANESLQFNPDESYTYTL